MPPDTHNKRHPSEAVSSNSRRDRIPSLKKREKEAQGLIGTNRMQLLPGPGLGGVEFIRTLVGGVGGERGEASCWRKWEEIGQLLCSSDGLGLRSLLMMLAFLCNMLK